MDSAHLFRTAVLTATLGLAASTGMVEAETASLTEAARQGDAARLRTLVSQRGHDVNEAEADGMTALHWVVRHDSLEGADLLLRAGANVRAVTRYGVTPLALAATNGNATIVKRLLDAGADPNGASPEGETVLMTAARTGVVETLDVLLARGAAVDAVEGWRGQTALMWAAAGGRTAAAERLLRAGADIKKRSWGGFTPFLFAVREGNIETADLLLKHGARVEESLPDGTTALALAVINWQMDMALQLLERGADPNATDPRGSILHALTWIRTPGYPQINPTFFRTPPPDDDSFRVAESLLTRGANPNVRVAWKEQRLDRDLGVVKAPPNIAIARNFLTFVGATPFWLAAKHGDVRLMRLLVAHGADPMIPSRHNVTPLMVAAGLGFWDAESPSPPNGTPESQTLEAVKLALELGGNINDVADFGDLPLEGTGQELRHRHPENLEKLQAEYPDLMLGDMRWGGATALHGAALRGANSVVQFLVDQGAKIDAKTKYGWTPYQMAEGVFASNAERVQPSTAEYIEKLLKDRGLWEEELASGQSPAEALHGK